MAEHTVLNTLGLANTSPASSGEFSPLLNFMDRVALHADTHVSRDTQPTRFHA